MLRFPFMVPTAPRLAWAILFASRAVPISDNPRRFRRPRTAPLRLSPTLPASIPPPWTVRSIRARTSTITPAAAGSKTIRFLRTRRSGASTPNCSRITSASCGACWRRPQTGRSRSAGRARDRRLFHRLHGRIGHRKGRCAPAQAGVRRNRRSEVGRGSCRNCWGASIWKSTAGHMLFGFGSNQDYEDSTR